MKITIRQLKNIIKETFLQEISQDRLRKLVTDRDRNIDNPPTDRPIDTIKTDRVKTDLDNFARAQGERRQADTDKGRKDFDDRFSNSDSFDPDIDKVFDNIMLKEFIKKIIKNFQF